MSEEKHCDTCICGRRAPVQGDVYGVKGGRGAGSIAWSEHLLAYTGYAREFGRSQTADRLADRGGFSYAELVRYLGREPTTWQPAR